MTRYAPDIIAAVQADKRPAWIATIEAVKRAMEKQEKTNA